MDKEEGYSREHLESLLKYLGDATGNEYSQKTKINFHGALLYDMLTTRPVLLFFPLSYLKMHLGPTNTIFRVLQIDLIEMPKLATTEGLAGLVASWRLENGV